MSIDPPFALKTFQDRYLESQQARARFIREAETWVRLEKHQNIVRAHWVQNIQDKPYIVLEYITNPEMRGADLGRWIMRGLEIPQVLNFVIQFCDGMHYAHRKVGIVHRDIKPGNILVTQEKVVKITDFGLVKTDTTEASEKDFLRISGEEIVSEQNSFTHTGTIMGTFPYMSPEQYCNLKDVDIRSDIYAFGAVLFEMLTGRRVFDATTFEAFKYCHLHKPPPSPASMVSGLPRNLEAVVVRCLAKKPEERYPNFAVLREELAGIYYTLVGERIAPPAEGDVLEGWEWANKGASLYDLGYTKEALNCYDHALELDPGNTKIWNNKGTTLAKIGRYEEALTCYDHVLSMDPNNFDALLNKGVFLYDLGRYNEALACCEQALILDSKAVDVWTNKGACLNGLGRYEEAFVCHDRALSLDSKNAKAWLNKGNSELFPGHLDEALIHYDHALSIEPTYIGAWLNKGVALQKLAQYEEAIECVDRALVLDSKCFEAWFNKGCILLELRQPDKALLCYEYALNIDPMNASAWFQKGISLAKTRRYQEALSCFSKALEIDPQLENAKQALALCKQDLEQSYKD